MNGDERFTVLLVDEDPEHNLALAGILKCAGYGVRATATAREALTVLTGGPFELAIVDLPLPGKRGFDLLRAIRAMHAELSVVVITARGEWTSYLEAMNIGAVDYLTKPVRREDILASVRKALARRGIRRPDASAGESGDAGSAAA